MLFSLRLSFLTIGLVAVSSLSQAYPAKYGTSVIYTLDNNPNGASIIAMKISENRTVSSRVMTPTGGRGLSGVTGPGQPNVGSLFGSDAVVVADDVGIPLLFEALTS